jgi:hypothetical protein
VHGSSSGSTARPRSSDGARARGGRALDEELNFCDINHMILTRSLFRAAALCLALSHATTPRTAEAQSYATVGAVELEASVRETPARITLRWLAMSGSTGFTVFRKLRTATSWGTAVATLAGSATEYNDDGVAAGTLYEYRVVRTGSPNGTTASAAPGTGYITSGIGVGPVERPGAILLVVDDTLASALSSRITQLTTDLQGEGWVVHRRDVSRTAAVTAVRSTINAVRTEDSRLRAVYLIGHVPVPYAGNMQPDGHGEHQGAWPADSYYADLDGSYTDSSVNNNGAARAENRNIPGDGKFDQNSPPSSVEVEVGRVDFENMPAFSRTETQLVQDYLDRAHAFRTRASVPTNRGLVWDNINWAGYALAASAHRASSALVGIANTTRYSEFTSPSVYSGPYFNLVDDQSYLFAAHYAGGSYTGSGAGNTSDLAGSIDNGAVFIMSLGSYFGDWDNQNNFLRAQIARGAGLASVWSGLPNWWLHPLAMGETTGACARIAHDNGSSGLYTPHQNGWSSSVGRGHLALHGDPALRMRYVGQPGSFAVTNTGGNATFTWTAASGSPDGYFLYERNPTTNELSRVVATMVTGTSHSTGSVALVSGRTYAIRAAKLEQSATGTYWNLGLAAFATASTSTPAMDAGVPDMAIPPPDMSVPRDMATAPIDMATPPDMATPRDMATAPVDMAAAFDSGDERDAEIEDGSADEDATSDAEASDSATESPREQTHYITGGCAASETQRDANGSWLVLLACAALTARRRRER